MDHLVCTICLDGLVNDDWTAIEENHSAISTAEALGMVTHTGSENHGVYRCTVCDEDNYGRAEIVTAA